MRDILTALEVDGEIGNLEGEEEKRQKDKLPALKRYTKK